MNTSIDPPICNKSIFLVSGNKQEGVLWKQINVHYFTRVEIRQRRHAE